jgi:exonuclease V
MIGIIDEIRMPIDGISFQPILVDSKTRVRSTIPSEAQKGNGRFTPYCFFPIHLMNLHEVVLMLC